MSSDTDTGRRNPRVTARIVAGSALFALAQLLITPPYALMTLATFPLPPIARYRVISGWSRIMIVLARLCCGIRYRVSGRANLPDTPSVVLSKHQSTWETLAFQVLLPPQVHVLKRELLRIPFFGWGLALMSPIAIDRGAGARALRQLAQQGTDRLARGFWIIVFPEGTRVAPGSRGKYHVGGAWLATQAGASVVPVAHDAGRCWPRHSFLKFPGTVHVSFGPPIETQGRDAQSVIRDVEHWIEDEMPRLGSH